MGRLTTNGMTEPAYPGRLNCNDDEMLSVFCTFGYLQKQGEAVSSLMKPLFARLDAIAEARGLAKDILYVVLAGSTLQQLMKTVGMSDEEVKETDGELKKIVNRKN